MFSKYSNDKSLEATSGIMIVDVENQHSDPSSNPRGRCLHFLPLILFTNPSARAGYDTRSIFKAEFNRS